MKKQYIILGSSGFIGTALKIKLQQDKKNKVFEISRKNSDILKNNKWMSLIKQNSTIYFLAFENNLYYFEKEYSKLTLKYNKFCINLFSYLKLKKIRVTIIFSSTTSLYGLNNNIITPISWYDFNKLLIEEYMKFFGNLDLIKFINLRLSNVYGANIVGQKNRGFINKIISDLVFLKSKEIKLFDNGRFFRDYIYIDDVTNALVLANKIKIKNQTFDICYGKSYSILKVVKLIKNITKINVKIHNCKMPNNFHAIEKRNFFGSSYKFSKVTGWKPKTNIRYGIKKTILNLLKSQKTLT